MKHISYVHNLNKKQRRAALTRILSYYFIHLYPYVGSRSEILKYMLNIHINNVWLLRRQTQMPKV